MQRLCVISQCARAARCYLLQEDQLEILAAECALLKAHRSICPIVCYIFLSISQSIAASRYGYVNLFVNLSVHQPVCVYICMHPLFIHLPMYTSTGNLLYLES